MRILAIAFAFVLAACGRDSTAAEQPTTIVELDKSLEAVRTAFNAHKGEARFLTLLSPT